MYKFPEVDRMYWERSGRSETDINLCHRRILHPVPKDPPCVSCEHLETCGEGVCVSFQRYAGGYKVSGDTTPSRELYDKVFPRRKRAR